MRRALLRSLFIAGLSAVVGQALGGEVSPRSWLGVVLKDAVDGGVEIVALVPGGPADRAGIRVGDIVVRAERASVTDRTVLEPLLERRTPGQALDFVVLRGRRSLARTIQLGQRPEAPSPLAVGPEASSVERELRLSIARLMRKIEILESELADLRESR